MNNMFKGAVFALLGASCWGLGAMAGKYLTVTKGWDPVWMVCLRLLSAGFVLFLIALMQAKRSTGTSVGNSHDLFSIFKRRSSLIQLILVGIFAFAICQATYFVAIDLSNPGVASAIQQIAPVFVMVYVLLTEKRSPMLSEIFVLIAAIFGAFMLATNGDIGVLIIPVGALLAAIASAITCACYTIMPRPLIVEYGTFPVSGFGMLIGGIFMIPVSRFWNFTGVMDAQAVLAFSFVVIVGTVIAFASFLYGVTIVGPAKGSIYALIEPVVATAGSALILGQHFSAADYIGIASILGGVAALTLISNKPHRERVS